MPASISLDDLPPLISPAQLSEFLGVPEQTLAVWRSTGRVAIPYVKVGSLVRYPRESVRSHLESASVDAGQPARKGR